MPCVGCAFDGRIFGHCGVTRCIFAPAANAVEVILGLVVDLIQRKRVAHIVLTCVGLKAGVFALKQVHPGSVVAIVECELDPEFGITPSG